MSSSTVTAGSIRLAWDQPERRKYGPWRPNTKHIRRELSWFASETNRRTGFQFVTIEDDSGNRVASSHG